MSEYDSESGSDSDHEKSRKEEYETLERFKKRTLPTRCPWCPNKAPFKNADALANHADTFQGWYVEN
jgi:hypothetical protein